MKELIVSIPNTALFLFLSVWRLPSWLPAQFSRRHPSVVELATRFRSSALNGADAVSQRGSLRRMEAMATLVAQTKRVLGFFGRIVRQLYDARLARAERDVNYHRALLGKERK
jgi:hypothetical protein